MEQIIVAKADGATYPLAVKSRCVAMSSAKQTWQLLGEDKVEVSVTSPVPVDSYSIGDRITVFGRHYVLNRLPGVKRTAGGFQYDLTFEGVQYDLMRVTYDLTIDTTRNELQDVQADTLTGNLERFAQVLVSNANRVFPGKWALGACPATVEDKTLTFGESDNCLSVLQTLCTSFEVEFSIVLSDGVYTISFAQETGHVFPYVFAYGKGRGLYELTRGNVDSSNIVTRLKVFGSSSNITSKYRAARLCLPGKSKGQSYLENAAAMEAYGVYEATKYFEDIKPTFDGSVTAVVENSVVKFVDMNMFDLNAKEEDGVTTKYLIDGCSAKVHFNTGNLAGYEFEVHAYDHATHTFTLVKITDERGDVFPSASSAAFQFKEGDKYKLIDCALPQSYEDAAESKLQEEGEAYLAQNCQPKVKYSLKVSKFCLEKLFKDSAVANVFEPGDYIHIKDSDIGVDKAVRVKAISRDLMDEYSYALTLADGTVKPNIQVRVISSMIEQDKINRINNLADPARARANWRSSQELMNMVFDPDGDYYSEKIKPLSIDTLMLSVGAKAMQFGLTNTVFEPNYNGDRNTIKITGGVLTHYTIKEDSAASWNMADSTYSGLENAVPYYIYARCARNGDSGVFTLSDKQIRVEEDAANYHFWVGVLNSVDAGTGVRTIALSYGFSTINGRYIKTGRIVATDGKTYFDLDNGEICGNIVFLSNGEKKTLEDFGFDNTKTAIDGGIVTSGTVQVVGDVTDAESAGMTGANTAGQSSGKSVRFWAGSSYGKRADAPFRVLQDGNAYLEKLHAYGAEILNTNKSKYQKIEIIGNMIRGMTKGETDMIISNDDNPGLGKLSEVPSIPSQIALSEGFCPPMTAEYLDNSHKTDSELALVYYDCELLNYVIGYLPGSSVVNISSVPQMLWTCPYWLQIEDGLSDYNIENLLSGTMMMNGVELWLYKDGVKYMKIGSSTALSYVASSSLLTSSKRTVSFTKSANSVSVDEGGIFSLRVICPKMIYMVDAQEYTYSDDYMLSFVNGYSYPVEYGDFVANPYMVVSLQSGSMSVNLPGAYKGFKGLSSFKNGFVHRNNSGSVMFSEDGFVVMMGTRGLKLTDKGLFKSSDSGATWTAL